MTERSRFALSLARPYIRWRLRRAFDGLFVAGLDDVREQAARGPILIAANHVCWWDALTILALDEPLGIESHCLMDAKNLSAMPFFKWVGAVPLDRTSPRASLRHMQSALLHLTQPRQSLWVFPQGEQRPAHLRPLGLHKGAHWLARKSGATVVPLSLSYLYREAPVPTIVARFGAPLTPPARDAVGWLSNLERALVEGLAESDRFVLSGAGAFVALVAPQQGTRVPVAGRLLTAAMGGGGSKGESHG